MYTLHTQGMYQQHMYILHGMHMLNPRVIPYNNTVFILSLFPAAV